jgi:biotin synthase
MKQDIQKLIEKLERKHSLTKKEYLTLIKNRNSETEALLREKAVTVRKSIYGNKVFTRGLIEFTNICKNDCFYCGIRKSNSNCHRYRLTKEEIISCTEEGYSLGFRTFVLQGGEDPFFTDERLCDLVKTIKKNHPDCAVTLSVGERSKKSYKLFKEAGTDRYLLRHETATNSHYKKLHPRYQKLSVRKDCLRKLKKLGFATGAGFMVGSPYQTEKHLAADLKFIEKLQPQMCGIGPFIPHKDTPFKDFPAGSAELTCFLLSIIRLIKPDILLPATTALGTVKPDGRELGILSGANVVMPNLSPVSVRKDYSLYDNKICTGEESAQCRFCLDKKIKSIGYETVIDRGDIPSV